MKKNIEECPLEFFDAIYCITLNPASPRAQIAEAQFRSLGLCVEFITGERTDPYQKGCAEAHLKCIELAKRKNCQNVLIFEDDVAFINYDSKILEECIKSLPSSWEFFFLGGRLWENRPMKKITDGLLKAKVDENHAYAINRTVFDEILSWNLQPEDHITKLYEQFSECYTVFPLMTLQVDRTKPHRSTYALHSNLRIQYAQ